MKINLSGHIKGKFSKVTFRANNLKDFERLYNFNLNQILDEDSQKDGETKK